MAGTGLSRGFAGERGSGIEKTGIRPIVEGALLQCVEVSSRVSPEWEYIFIQNFSDKPTDTGDVKWEGEWMSGKSLKENSRLEAYGTRILRRRIKSSV